MASGYDGFAAATLRRPAPQPRSQRSRRQQEHTEQPPAWLRFLLIDRVVNVIVGARDEWKCRCALAIRSRLRHALATTSESGSPKDGLGEPGRDPDPTITLPAHAPV